MQNKANKSSKKVKSPTANAEVAHLPKEPLSVLVVAVEAAVVAVALRVVLKRKVAVAVKRVRAKRVVQRRVQVKMIRQQLTGLKLT